MSTMEYKVCLRVALPGIKNKQEHHKWFVEHVGEPTSVEEYNGKIEYFTYRYDDNYKPIPHTGPFLSPCDDDGIYGVEMVISWTKDEGEMVELSKEKLDILFSGMEALPGIGGTIKLHSYSWYNGGAHDVVNW